MNALISKEKYERKCNLLQNEGESTNKRWKTIKREMGQSTFTSPQVIKEGASHHTSHKSIADSLNRQYVRRVNKIVEEMEETEIDPMTNYNRSIRTTPTTFTFKKLSMSELRIIVNKMKSTGSTGNDDISMRNIKQAQRELEPVILHLVNRCITTTTFPESLKISRVVPIEKKGKDIQSAEGWRPVNILNALSKILEQVFLSQITRHMDDNNFIGQAHHGAVKYKSTQTLVTELHDLLIEDLTNNNESVLIVLDQSKAYDIVSHEILLKKFSALGFQPQAINLMSSFLENRRQFVQVEGIKSEILVTGPHSVVQGSTLSCIFFLIFILDMPDIYHETNHDPGEQRNCIAPNLKTFVDDAFIRARRKSNESFEETVEKNLRIVTEYMKANKMQLNPEKTTVMLVTKDDDEKRQFEIEIGGKKI